jgi:hypothetical protein
MNIYTHTLTRDVYNGKNELQASKGQMVSIQSVFADVCIVEDTTGKRFDVRREYLISNDQKTITHENNH